jgi:hypothetical protein
MEELKMKYNIMLLIALLCSGCVMAEPRLKATFHVSDAESGSILTNSSVTVYNDGWDTKNVDENGNCSFEGEGMSFGWKARAKSDGYYDSEPRAEFSSINHILGRWEPWNPTVEALMRPKKNPVPMVHVYTEWKSIPKASESVGYDLEAGDWVAPHGKGTRADFTVHFSGYFQDAKKGSEARYILSFPNKFDGIQQYVCPKDMNSSFRWPYEAPLDGYLPSLEKFKHWDRYGMPDKSNYDETNNYIFRVRSRQREDGTLEACYGMIEGELEYIPQGKIKFKYWFNPTPNERSLEWNGANLLKK